MLGLFDIFGQRAPSAHSLDVAVHSLERDAAGDPRGDTFLPVELLAAVRDLPERRRARERAALDADDRRPVRSPGLESVAAAAIARESWRFGADPMIWSRTRLGQSALREAIAAKAARMRDPLRALGAWIGGRFSRS